MPITKSKRKLVKLIDNLILSILNLILHVYKPKLKHLEKRISLFKFNKILIDTRTFYLIHEERMYNK